MAQHDYVIANGTGAAVRSDLNNALAAIVSTNAGTTEPTTTYAHMLWADTTANQLKLRNAANNAWIVLRDLDGDLVLGDGSAATPSLQFSTSGTDTGLYSPGADQVAVSTGGTERVEWGASEVVFNDGGENYDFRIEGDTNSTLFFVDASADTVEINGDVTITDKIIHSGDTNTAIRFPAADTVSVEVDGGEALRVDSSKRLLVGTSSARSNFFNTSAFSALLQIEGTSDPTRVISFVHNTNGQEQPLLVLGKSRGTTAGSNTVVVNNDTLGTLSFQGADGTELVEAARISCDVDGACGANDMPGRLVFSVTRDGQSSPTEAQRIENTGVTNLFAANGSNSLIAYNATGAGTGAAVFVGKYGATGPVTGGTNSIIIWTNGDIVNANNSYGSLSDIKLKENIVNANSQWSDLKALQVRNYNFKEGQTHTQIGLIAQEVELVSPGLVSESPDRDAEGNDLGTVTKSVNYSVLYMKAVKALQEAMERIETLEAKVTALEAS